MYGISSTEIRFPQLKSNRFPKIFCNSSKNLPHQQVLEDPLQSIEKTILHKM